MSENNAQFYISATIENLSETGVILILEDGQKISLPREKLPPDIVQGKTLKLNLTSQEELARAMLNEILKKD